MQIEKYLGGADHDSQDFINFKETVNFAEAEAISNLAASAAKQKMQRNQILH